MNKPVNISRVNKILTATLFIIALPIFLQFGSPILVPAMLLVGLNVFWLIGGMFSVTGVLAIVVGLVATIWLQINHRRINNAETILLGKWVAGLTVSYVLIIAAMVLFQFVASRIY